MSTYASTYTSLLDKVNIKYLPYNNLFHLKNYRQKVNCYQENSKQPDLYYECFQRVQMKVAQQSQAFTKNYHFIEDQYKSCQQNCTASYTNEKQIKQCSQKCGSKFIKSTFDLYDNFYKMNLSAQPEYKKIRK